MYHKETPPRKTTDTKVAQGLAASPSRHLFRVDFIANGVPSSGLDLGETEEEVWVHYANKSTSKESLIVLGVYPEPA
jgi:hypothetical protein